MARTKKPTAQQQAIIDKATELNDLLAKLPKSFNNNMAINNMNQAINFLLKNN